MVYGMTSGNPAKSLSVEALRIVIFIHCIVHQLYRINYIELLYSSASSISNGQTLLVSLGGETDPRRACSLAFTKCDTWTKTSAKTKHKILIPFPRVFFKFGGPMFLLPKGNGKKAFRMGLGSPPTHASPGSLHLDAWRMNN